MKSKKGIITFTGVVISVLIVMALFYGTFEYLSTNYISANVTEQIGYNQSYADLQESEATLNESIENIKGAARNISEADGGVVAVAWNGLKGLASTMRLFFAVIDVAIDVWNAILPGLSFLPTWTKLLIEMALVITVVMVIVGLFKGEART